MKRFLCSSLLALSAILVSCHKPTEPDTEVCSLERSAKLQTGNWWVYECHELDLNDREVGTEYIDSTVVEGTAVKYGATAYMLVHYVTRDGGTTYTTDTTWMAVAGGRVMMLPSNIHKMFCDCLDDRWVTAADCSAGTWEALKAEEYESLPSRILKEDGTDSMVTSTTSRSFRITGRLEKEGAMMVGGQLAAVREYSMDNWFEVRLIEPEDVRFVNGTRTATQTSRTSITLADRIGMIEFRSTAVYLQETPGVEIHNGIVKRLLRHSVR